MMKMISKGICVAIALMLTNVASGQAVPANGSASNKVHTREELRACLALKDRIAASSDDLQRRNSQHEARRTTVRSLNDGLSAAKPDVDVAMDAYRSADAAVREHAKLIDKWNEEVQEVDASKMKSAERRKAALKKERVELEAKNRELTGIRDEMGRAYDAAVARYNTLVKDAEGQIKTWNEANEALVRESESLADQRVLYAEKCAGNRYNQKDEEAVRQGR